MVQVNIGTECRNYPEDTTWLQVAEEYQKQYGDDILLVKIGGKLQELHKRVREGELEFITAREKPGMATYQRSITLMMLKAFYSVAGAEKVKKVSVDFSLGNGVFVEAEGDFVLDEALL